MLDVSLIVLKFLNGIVNGDYAYLALITALLSYAVVFIVEVLIILITRKNRDLIYFSCFSLIVLITSFVFAYKDLLSVKKLFLDGSFIVVYLSALTIIILLSLMLLKGLCSIFSIAKTKKPQKAVKAEEYRSIEIEPEYFNAEKKLEFNYLDVNYVKELIYKLKQKELADSDLNELEELEVYLLNFATRQPYATERAKLSLYLSSLIKKLAKYAV